MHHLSMEHNVHFAIGDFGKAWIADQSFIRPPLLLKIFIRVPTFAETSLECTERMFQMIKESPMVSVVIANGQAQAGANTSVTVGQP